MRFSCNLGRLALTDPPPLYAVAAAADAAATTALTTSWGPPLAPDSTVSCRRLAEHRGSTGNPQTLPSFLGREPAAQQSSMTQLVLHVLFFSSPSASGAESRRHPFARILPSFIMSREPSPCPLPGSMPIAVCGARRKRVPRVNRCIKCVNAPTSASQPGRGGDTRVGRNEGERRRVGGEGEAAGRDQKSRCTPSHSESPQATASAGP